MSPLEMPTSCCRYWPVWLLVNTIAVPLYASRGLYLTAVLYAGFRVNAIVSWIWWRKLAARDAAASPAPLTDRSDCAA